MHPIRERIEALERETLSPYAARAGDSAGRPRAEAADPVRTCFQRDRDRILHAKPFRRLKHKTQVFIKPEGDHYRTRLTHTLEVAQIARTIARALRLNEDLVEAIALGHDVGHTPFGHAGERALDDAIREDGGEGFRHNEHSVRVLMELENLNLTHEVVAGIAGHSKGERDLTDADGELTSTLEAAVVRISDRIAYLNHDLDDALRSGIISEAPREFLEIGDRHGTRVGAMVEDVVRESEGCAAIRISPAMRSRMNDLKDWLFQRVYNRYPEVLPDILKSERLVRELYAYYRQPGALPAGFEGRQGAIDYVAGMTDRFAILTFDRLRRPQGFDAFP